MLAEKLLFPPAEDLLGLTGPEGDAEIVVPLNDRQRRILEVCCQRLEDEFFRGFGHCASTTSRFRASIGVLGAARSDSLTGYTLREFPARWHHATDFFPTGPRGAAGPADRLRHVSGQF